MNKRQLLLLGIILLVLFACDEKVDKIDDMPLGTSNIIQQVSLDENHYVTYQIANVYANAHFGKTKGKTISIEPIIEGRDTLAYIVNYDNTWELLAADTRYTPILAKGYGKYNLDELSSGQKTWLEAELYNIKAVRDGELVVDEKEMRRNHQFWKKICGPQFTTKAEGDPTEDNLYWELIEIIDYDYVIENTGHLVETQWGQDWPWNAYIPYVEGNSGDRCKAGCVGVAGAQLLKFLSGSISKPVETYTNGVIIGDKDNWTFSYSNLSPSAWNNMALNRYESTSRINQSALLIAWVANQIDTDFGESSSTTTDTWDELKDLLSELEISYLYSDYDNMLNHISYYLINRRQPCIIGASRNKIGIGDITINYKNGHVWLIDGYYRETFYKKYIYQWTSRTDNHLYEYGEIKEEIESEQDAYLLMNWGAEGQHDNALYASGPNATWQIVVNGETKHYRYNRNIIYDFN